MELKEAKQKIKEMKSLFIRQCRSGVWKQYSSMYANDYFYLLESGNIKIGNDTISPVDIGISIFRFFFLKLMIKYNARNYKKNNNKIHVAILSDKFFENHKDLKRDNKLNKLLN